MFGLHGRAKTLRIETRARNVLALLPDASGAALPRHTIKAGGPTAVAHAHPRAAPARGGARGGRAGGAVARCRALFVQLSLLARGRGGDPKRRPKRRGFRPCAPCPAQSITARERRKTPSGGGRSGAGGRRYPVRHRFSTALTSAGAKCPAHGPHPPPPHRRRDRRRRLRSTGTCRAAVHIRARCSAFRRTSRRSRRPERRLATRHRSGGAHARPA